MLPTLCHVILNSVHQFTLLFVNIFVDSLFDDCCGCCCFIGVVVGFTLLELGAGDNNFEVDGIGSEDILLFDVFSVVGELKISPTHFLEEKKERIVNICFLYKKKQRFFIKNFRFLLIVFFFYLP